MQQMNTTYYPGHASNGITAGSIFPLYETVTVKTTTTTTRVISYGLYGSLRQPKKCEKMTEGLVVSRTAGVTVFGELELAVLLGALAM